MMINLYHSLLKILISNLFIPYLLSKNVLIVVFWFPPPFLTFTPEACFVNWQLLSDIGFHSLVSWLLLTGQERLCVNVRNYHFIMSDVFSYGLSAQQTFNIIIFICKTAETTLTQHQLKKWRLIIWFFFFNQITNLHCQIHSHELSAAIRDSVQIKKVLDDSVYVHIILIAFLFMVSGRERLHHHGELSAYPGTHSGHQVGTNLAELKTHREPGTPLWVFLLKWKVKETKFKC